MAIIYFTSVEADVLRHRLDFLAGMDDEDLGELFPEHAHPEELAKMAELASAQLYDGRLAVTVAHADTLTVLAEAVEGATIHDLAKDEASIGKISYQKRDAYRMALASAAAKIEQMLGRPLAI